MLPSLVNLGLKRPNLRQGFGKDFCHSVLLYASICTFGVLHNPLTGNKKPRNGGSGASAWMGWFLQLACAKLSKSPCFPHIRSFPGKVPARILTSLGLRQIQPERCWDGEVRALFPISGRFRPAPLTGQNQSIVADIGIRLHQNVNSHPAIRASVNIDNFVSARRSMVFLDQYYGHLVAGTTAMNVRRVLLCVLPSISHFELFSASLAAIARDIPKPCLMRDDFSAGDGVFT